MTAQVFSVDRFRHSGTELVKARTDLVTVRAARGTNKNKKRHGQTKIKHVWHDGVEWRSRVLQGHDDRWNGSATSHLFECL